MGQTEKVEFEGGHKIIYTKNRGRIKVIYFNNDIQKHRGGGLPAIIEYDENKMLRLEEYYENGIVHREGTIQL